MIPCCDYELHEGNSHLPIFASELYGIPCFSDGRGLEGLCVALVFGAMHDRGRWDDVAFRRESTLSCENLNLMNSFWK